MNTYTHHKKPLPCHYKYKKIPTFQWVFSSIFSKNYLDFFELAFVLEAFFVAQDLEALFTAVFEDDFLAQELLLQHLESCSTAIDQKYSS